MGALVEAVAQLKAPIYATPFTAVLFERAFRAGRTERSARENVVPLGRRSSVRSR